MSKLTFIDLRKFEGQKVVMIYKNKATTITVNQISVDRIKSATGREYLIDLISDMHLQVPYCIGRRYNPQLDKPYFRKFGTLTPKEIRDKQKCLYGGMTIETFDSEESYNRAIEKIKSQGYNIY